MKRYERTKRNEERNIVKCDEKQLIESIQTHPVYVYVSTFHHSYKEISNMVFSHNKHNIYKYLIQPENDAMVYALL